MAGSEVEQYGGKCGAVPGYPPGRWCTHDCTCYARVAYASRQTRLRERWLDGYPCAHGFLPNRCNWRHELYSTGRLSKPVEHRIAGMDRNGVVPVKALGSGLAI